MDHVGDSEVNPVWDSEMDQVWDSEVDHVWDSEVDLMNYLLVFCCCTCICKSTVFNWF